MGDERITKTEDTGEPEGSFFSANYFLRNFKIQLDYFHIWRYGFRFKMYINFLKNQLTFPKF